MSSSEKEADITISGVTLSPAQSGVIRVAVGNMLLELSDKEFREQVGEELSNLYQARLGEIHKLIMLTAQ